MRNDSKFLKTMFNPYEVIARTVKVNKVVKAIDGLRPAMRTDVLSLVKDGDMTDEAWAAIEALAGVHPLSEQSRRAVLVKVSAE